MLTSAWSKDSLGRGPVCRRLIVSAPRRENARLGRRGAVALALPCYLMSGDGGPVFSGLVATSEPPP